MITHTKEELEFLRKIGINPKNLRYRWEWVDEEKALSFYREVIYPHFNRVPGIKEINKLGYRGFLNALKKICKSYVKFVKKAGFIPNVEYKYVGLDFDSLVKYFKKTIYPELKIRLSLDENTPPTATQINKNGYSSFLTKIYKKNKSYYDLIRAAGFNVNIFNQTNEELSFLKQIGVNPETLKTRWEWVNEKNAILFYRDVIYNHYNKAASEHEIDIIGYRGYRNAIKKTGKTLNTIVKELGLPPNFEYKYVGMNFQDLVNFFINTIYPDLKARLSLEEGKPPKRSQVANNGYRGFTYNLDKLKKGYGDLLKEAGFEPLKQFRYKGKSFQDLIKMFKTQIYPDLIGNKIIEGGALPTKEDLNNNEYTGFIHALRRMNKTWTGLLKAAGFKPRYVRLYDGKTYEELLNLFKNTIYPQLKQKYSLHKKEAPLYQHIEKLYRGLIAALTKKSKKYSDLIYDSDLISNDIIEKRVGVKLHHVLEIIFMEYTKKYNCHSYFEVSSIINSSKRSDNSIIRNLNFKKTIELKQNSIKIPENIKLVNIDYTLSSDRYNIKKKVKKGYQGKEKYLIIVYLGSNKDTIKVPNEIHYRNNIVILNYQDFAKFIGYSGTYLTEFNRAVKLARHACFIPKVYEELNDLAKKAKKELKKYKNRQKEFELYIKNKGLMHLLNEDISDINLDKWIAEEKEEVRENESSKKEIQAFASFKEKNDDDIIKENKEVHPFDRKFNEVVEEEDFNDPYLWISPKVRENIEENKEKLLEKVSERRVRYTDSLSAIESLNYFERGDLETKPKSSFINESSKEDLVENQPFINLESGIEPVHYMQHQIDPLPDMEQDFIPEKPPEKPRDDPPEKPPEKLIDDPPEKPIEKPIDDPPEKPPEKPIDDPPEKPPEKPIDDPPEKPPEKPIDEPPEKPPEKPIDEPPEMPPEMPPTSVIGVGVPSEVGVGIISNIVVPQFTESSSSLESQTEQENFDDDIENIGNEESYEEENLDDVIENLDNIDEDDDFNGIFDDTDPDVLDSNENDEIYNSPDDPVNFIDIGEYVPEAEADSSYGYSDCPDDCPSE